MQVIKKLSTGTSSNTDLVIKRAWFLLVLTFCHCANPKSVDRRTGQQDNKGGDLNATSGVAVKEQNIEISGTTDFGEVVMGSPYPEALFTLTNTKAKAATITALASSTPMFYVNYTGNPACTMGMVLEKDQSCQFKIQMITKKDRWPHSNFTFTFVRKNESSFSVSLPVSGKVTVPAKIYVQYQIDLGLAPVGQVSQALLTITHDANSYPASALTVTSKPMPAGLTIDKTECGNAPPKGGSCTIKIGITPTNTNNFSYPIDVAFFDGVTTQHMTTAIAGPFRAMNIRFTVDAALAQGTTLAQLQSNFADYVADINKVFAKNTLRQFVLPPNGVEIGPSPGAGVWWSTTTEQYEFHMYVQKRMPNTGDHGGAALFDYVDQHGNSMIASGFHWGRIFSRSDLSDFTNASNYYERQLEPLIHELGHLHGLAIGEYYTSKFIPDPTNILPLLTVNVAHTPTGPFWGSRTLAISDPMTELQLDNATIIDRLKFSPLSATLIDKRVNGADHGNWCEHLFMCTPVELAIATYPTVTVEVRDKYNRDVVPNCDVQVFSVDNRTVVDGTPIPYVRLAHGTTDVDGLYTFSWQYGPGVFHSTALLLKGACGNYKGGDWISTFDLQAGRTMPNGGAPNDYRYPGKFILQVE